MQKFDLIEIAIKPIQQKISTNVSHDAQEIEEKKRKTGQFGADSLELPD